MNLLVNNEEIQLSGTNNLLEVLASIKLNSLKGIAVAVNNKVIPKNQLEHYVVEENDSILIIKASQGG